MPMQVADYSLTRTLFYVVAPPATAPGSVSVKVFSKVDTTKVKTFAFKYFDPRAPALLPPTPTRGCILGKALPK